MRYESTLPDRLPESNFFNSMLRYWPLIVAAVMIILGYGTIKSSIQELQAKVSANEISVQAANASYANLSGDIKGINAKLDIIIRKTDL